MPGFDEGRARFATRVSPAWADPRVGLQIVTIDEQIGDVDQVVFAHPLPSSPRIINHQSRRHRSLLRCNLIDPFNVASIHGARGRVVDRGDQSRQRCRERPSRGRGETRIVRKRGCKLSNPSIYLNFSKIRVSPRETESIGSKTTARNWPACFLSRRILFPGSS